MLTSDLVRVRIRKGVITVGALGPKNRPLALDAAAGYLAATRGLVGATRAEWTAACDAVPVPARAKKLTDGLRKLVDDRCDFSMEDGPDPAALREAVFERASAARQALGPGEWLDRDAVLAEVAAEQDLAPDVLERRLYGDLKSAWTLRSFEDLSPEELVDAYELSQAQAVLLRAVRVRVVLHGGSAKALRNLFRKLKFLRLLHVVRVEDGAHVVELDGPMSLFGPSTKYGLQLALLLPALDRTGPYSLSADVVWGSDKKRLRFEHEGGGDADEAGADVTSDDAVDKLAGELRTLGKKAGDAGWSVRRSTKILDLPGVGLCVPDLVLTRDGATVYVEVMGYWSRDAVWKRVDLVEGGLLDRVLFCVSSRLRVSEEALGDDVPGSLYVYKGVMHAKSVLEKVELLGAR